MTPSSSSSSSSFQVLKVTELLLVGRPDGRLVFSFWVIDYCGRVCGVALCNQASRGAGGTEGVEGKVPPQIRSSDFALSSGGAVWPVYFSSSANTFQPSLLFVFKLEI